ncbi:MAG: NADH-quinone oxidoreductase subunit NuoK [Chloroflexi bacterium]|nr:NADH-quinone oxidoreductase subunit NuoK [Chloroflexota bacterium]MYA51285.1 NADH-quinone oxidoreductase subunit NuoK [Chloroflexota bacterium]MYK34846.1 NADH-quinone oxidoreductase subunit NuoK [Chloroflexota bacterium]
MTLLHFQLLSAAIFCIGLYGVLARRSAVLVLMSIELMLNAVNLQLVAFGAFSGFGTSTGQVIAVFVITIAAAEVGLALAIVMRLFRSRGGVNLDEIDVMRG